MGLITHFENLKLDWRPILTTTLTLFYQFFPPYNTRTTGTISIGTVFHTGQYVSHSIDSNSSYAVTINKHFTAVQMGINTHLGYLLNYIETTCTLFH